MDRTHSISLDEAEQACGNHARSGSSNNLPGLSVNRTGACTHIATRVLYGRRMLIG